MHPSLPWYLHQEGAICCDTNRPMDSNANRTSLAILVTRVNRSFLTFEIPPAVRWKVPCMESEIQRWPETLMVWKWPGKPRIHSASSTHKCTEFTARFIFHRPVSAVHFHIIHACSHILYYNEQIKHTDYLVFNGGEIPADNDSRTTLPVGFIMLRGN